MKMGRYIRDPKSGRFTHIDAVQSAMAWGERIGVIAMLIIFTVLAVVVGG